MNRVQIRSVSPASIVVREADKKEYYVSHMDFVRYSVLIVEIGTNKAKWVSPSEYVTLVPENVK